MAGLAEDLPHAGEQATDRPLATFTNLTVSVGNAPVSC